MCGTKIFRPAFAERLAGDAGHTILVTGGAGFIGSHLCHRLIAQGDRVICVDNLETGREDNIADLLTNPNFAFFLYDIVDPFTITGPIDRIYNMACPGSPSKYQRDPVHTFKTSIIGGINLLELAKKKSARILQSSTSEVYGDPDVSPQSEDYRGSVNTTGPRACYDEGKRGAETLFYNLHESEGVDTRIARIFNTYGPKMDPEDGRVVSNFIVQAYSGDDLTVYGNGTQTRSFCYIDDMLDGLMTLMETESECGTIDDPVNLGNPDEFSVLELAEIVLDMIESDSKLVYKDLPVDDPHQRCPDISRAKALLGWEPKVSLKEGLVPTVACFGEEMYRQQRDQRGVV
ncbi:UDP-glucuronic acid decarboxylase family protein [Alisedimentitalea sp. MJ-SS2]|uniref:UDP-glucuronic acid decarboxylase family protein n=1 Tax=Aliisedimentitalea sp. MJ-SS2 TaxID=3049795 RepID=UPI0029085A80|nr:UDP-glucuronic acid decarboxylase family protein [Alisedimentitalea sp. MJ-SS2]MDU8925956.1 UDP-glucuronic acid decarboxylase family protein [Alisedimentitalea sp. MJ-SS2]